MFTGIVQGVGSVRAVEPRGGDVRLVFDSGVVSLADIEPGGSIAVNGVCLTATEFDVLWCLVEASNRPLSREEILSRVWGPGHHGTLRTIDNFVLQLRNKLENDPSEPDHLLTVRGVGYRFRS